MVCVNNCEEVEELEDYLQLMHVQYNSDDSFEYVVDYVECTDLSVNSDDRTALYKVDNRLTGEDFLEDLKLQIDSFKIDKHERDETKRPEFKVRGYKIEYTREEMKEMYMCDVFLPRSTLVIVKNPKKQPFKLVAEQHGLLQTPEICEECDEKKLLTIECACQKVFYCGIGCRIKNLYYHRVHCKEANHIQSLLDLHQDYEPLPVPQLRHGLGNMGNTCYLNAVFNIIRHYPPFYEYIKKMDAKKMQQVNETGLNIFPFLYDAFVRMNFQPLDSAYFPYLLKGAIGLKNESVALSSPVHQVQPKRLDGVFPDLRGDHEQRRGRGRRAGGVRREDEGRSHLQLRRVQRMRLEIQERRALVVSLRDHPRLRAPQEDTNRVPAPPPRRVSRVDKPQR